MSQLTVTKIVKFCYGHHLPGYRGACGAQHGHNATLEVEVAGIVSPLQPPAPPGMVCDFGVLKRMIQEEVIDVLDHKNINDLPIENDKYKNAMIRMPTAENMVLWIKEFLFKHYGILLVRVRLYATDTSYDEWRKS